MSRASQLTLWRLSLLLAVALIGFTLWFAYDLAGTVRAFSAMAQLLGGEARIDWGGIAIVFGALALVGIIGPCLYLRWVWSRAFPHSAH